MEIYNKYHNISVLNMEKKLSVLELIKEEAKEEEAKTTETKEEKELKQKVKNAFFLIQKI
jgi:ribosomal 50S subunit-recycling heat shock protein